MNVYPPMQDAVKYAPILMALTHVHVKLVTHWDMTNTHVLTQMNAHLGHLDVVISAQT